MGIVSPVIWTIVFATIVGVSLWAASLRWRGARKLSGLYWAGVIVIAVTMIKFLWRPRGAERKGGAELYIPGVQTELEDIVEDDFSWLASDQQEL